MIFHKVNYIYNRILIQAKKHTSDMKKKKTKGRKIVKSVFVFLIIVIIVVLTSATTLLFVVGSDITVNSETLNNRGSRLTVLNAQGNKIDTSSVVHEYANYNEINLNIINAFVALEDKRFFEHNGIDIKRIIGATVSNIKAGKIKEGASTITQQLIKNTHLTREQTIKRKLTEAKLAIKLEKEYSKEQILEWYLNAIYFGNGIYGIKGASKRFFNKLPNEVSLREAAALAGVVKNPSKYSPITNFENSVGRADLVLKLMYENGFISESDYNSASDETLKINEENPEIYSAPYIQAVLDEAVRLLGVSENDLIYQEYTIKTYFSEFDQRTLFDRYMMEEYFIANENGQRPSSSALLINNDTRGISAYYTNQPYSVYKLMRQPASAIKPFVVYAPAYEYGIISPITPILDEPIDIDGYSPQNYDKTYHGYVSAKQALMYSYNIPAVKIMNYTGIDKSISVAQNFGINFAVEDKNLAVALGAMTYGVNMVDFCGAYATLANNGLYTKAGFISEIINSKGQTVYKRNEISVRSVSEETAYLINSVLLECAKSGTAKKLSHLPYEIAAKTGTGSNGNDAWCMSYTTEYTLGIWYGNLSNNQRSALNSTVTGGSYPAILTRDIYSDIYIDKKPRNFTIPEGVEKLKIDNYYLESEQKVLLAPDYLSDSEYTEEWFSKKYSPSEYSTPAAPSFSDFSITIEDKKVKIEFKASSRYSYEIYRMPLLSESSLLASYENLNEQIVFVDEDPPYYTPTEYYIVVYAEDESLGTVIRKTIFIL